MGFERKKRFWATDEVVGDMSEANFFITLKYNKDWRGDYEFISIKKREI